MLNEFTGKKEEEEEEVHMSTDATVFSIETLPKSSPMLETE